MNTTSEMSRRREQVPEGVRPRAVVAPPVDVYESADEILILVDVPGATAESVSVTLDKGQLTIEAERASDAPGALVLSEYRPADYRRVFAVPESIDAAKIEAKLTAGVLEVRLPTSEAKKARRIQVKGA